jgi:uncharacterized protein YdiU (UPF0061 family)
MSVPFDNSYVQLPDYFYSRQLPQPVSRPGLIRVNNSLATLLGIDPAWLASEEGIATIAGNHIPDGADPIASVYAGHQFGSWNPQLGDGRAVLLGEVIGTDGERYDIQLKGSGQTPYSRMGDGRAPLGPVIREYIISEAMAALNIATSRTLAAVTTGDEVIREEALPGGVLARVAKSHIRIGTVQYLASRDDQDGLRLLINHVIQRHYPDISEDSNPALSLLNCVIQSQAELVASWQMIGFIHGVMNTDNVLLSGETIDYGPCAFMDTYDPAAVFSSIDQGGRYAYRNQPGIAHWNLACLAQALVPLLSDSEEDAIEMAKDALDRFPACFLEANASGLRRKLGLATSMDGDEILAKDFLDLLESHQKDFILSFRYLSELSGDQPSESVSSLFGFQSDFDDWLARWRERCQQEDFPNRQADMLATNPVIIPRNHLVEEAIASAYQGDFDPFHKLLDKLASPYKFDSEDLRFIKPPRPEEVVRQTFCGT